jgi:hypothetical protein
MASCLTTISPRLLSADFAWLAEEAKNVTVVGVDIVMMCG